MVSYPFPIRQYTCPLSLQLIGTELGVCLATDLQKSFSKVVTQDPNSNSVTRQFQQFSSTPSTLTGSRPGPSNTTLGVTTRLSLYNPTSGTELRVGAPATGKMIGRHRGQTSWVQNVWSWLTISQCFPSMSISRSSLVQPHLLFPIALSTPHSPGPRRPKMEPLSF